MARCCKEFESLCNRERGHQGDCYWEAPAAPQPADLKGAIERLRNELDTQREMTDEYDYYSKAFAADIEIVLHALEARMQRADEILEETVKCVFTEAQANCKCLKCLALDRVAANIRALKSTLLAAPAPSSEELRLPEGLDWQTRMLVINFASAMAEKLHAAQKKYGYDTGWTEKNWFDECRAKLKEHVEKGDPRDVANYCAFLWYHNQATSLPFRGKQKSEWQKQLVEIGHKHNIDFGMGDPELALAEAYELGKVAALTAPDAPNDNLARHLKAAKRRAKLLEEEALDAPKEKP